MYRNRTSFERDLTSDACFFVVSSILRSVFATTEDKVIRSTVQRLPPQYVSALVTELTALTQQKTLK